ncbi:MAG: hypothetical protein M2R45_03332 [Verrucomicrobia subdivision 3 bacterium]|nr:hypothetical protein [Limisphaerales bacterium]MCS1415387.1 hypothetical protein [Limisphaerales bacterium]
MEPIIETLQKGLEQLVNIVINTGADTETILIMAAGGVLLLFGRKLYWFIIAAAGFVAGTVIGHEVFPPDPQWLVVVASLLVGVVAAILSIFLQRLALRLAGMMAGGFLGYTVFAAFFAKPWPLVGLALGCLLGFWLMMRLFDWALIILSSLSGMALIVERLPLEREPLLILGLVLAVLGIAIQSSMQNKSAAGKREPKPA